MSMLRRLCWLPLAALCGCTSDFEVREITGLAHGKEITGIPFRTTLPQTLRVYKRDDKGHWQQVHVQYEEFADMSRVYSIGFDPDLLANSTLDLGLNEDSTLNRAGIETSLQIDEALTGLAKGANQVKDALAEIEEAEKKDREEAEADAEKAKQDRLDQENAVIAATEAFHAAETLIARLKTIPDDTPLADVVELQGQVAVAKAKANLAARRAGMSPPY